MRAVGRRLHLRRDRMWMGASDWWRGGCFITEFSCIGRGRRVGPVASGPWHSALCSNHGLPMPRSGGGQDSATVPIFGGQWARDVVLKSLEILCPSTLVIIGMSTLILMRYQKGCIRSRIWCGTSARPAEGRTSP